MLRIGEFSRLSQVSIKTLRYYDELGLFKPHGVDDGSGYRFYSVEQLPHINRIIALKALGLSLKQIARMLEDDLSAEEMRGMLRLRQAELESQLDEIETTLPQVQARLKLIEMEGRMPEYEVVLKDVDPILVASRRVTIPTNDEVPDHLTPAFDEAYAFVENSSAKKAGPGIAVWHSPHTADENEEVEAVFPIDRRVDGNERVQVHELPGVHVAAVVHDGDFELFGQGYRAVLQWIENNHSRITGPYREIYHKFEPDNLKDTLTEIQFPVDRD